MDYSDSRAAVNCNTDHTCYVVQVAFSEAFCAIEWVNPDDHVLFEELAGELEKVVVSLGCRHAVDLLHLLQVAPIPVLLHIVVLDEHFLTDVVLVEFIRHDVGSFRGDLVQVLVLFTNNRCARVKLFQVVHDRILDVHVHLGEYVGGAGTLLHGDVGEAYLSDSLDDLVRTLKQLDTSRHEFIQFDDSLHLCKNYQ